MATDEMDEIIELARLDFSSIFISVFVILIGIKVIISLLEWFVEKSGLETKWLKRRREDHELLQQNTLEIKQLSSNIDNLGNLLNEQYIRLDKKIDEQKEYINSIDQDGQIRDCAILRDRILSGMRYFEKNMDEHGIVHISVSDHENMEHLFNAYFSCNGNGTVKAMYDNEFKKWIIDN